MSLILYQGSHFLFKLTKFGSNHLDNLKKIQGGVLGNLDFQPSQKWEILWTFGEKLAEKPFWIISTPTKDYLILIAVHFELIVVPYLPVFLLLIP